VNQNRKLGQGGSDDFHDRSSGAVKNRTVPGDRLFRPSRGPRWSTRKHLPLWAPGADYATSAETRPCSKSERGCREHLRGCTTDLPRSMWAAGSDRRRPRDLLQRQGSQPWPSRNKHIIVIGLRLASALAGDHPNVAPVGQPVVLSLFLARDSSGQHPPGLGLVLDVPTFGFPILDRHDMRLTRLPGNALSALPRKKPAPSGDTRSSLRPPSTGKSPTTSRAKS